jgi:hypothetical protein
MAGLAIGANHCQQVKIFTDGRLVSDRETTFATLRVDIEEPSWDQEEGNELFHNYQFWIASDNYCVPGGVRVASGRPALTFPVHH